MVCVMLIVFVVGVFVYVVGFVYGIGLYGFVVIGIVFDFVVQMNMVFGQCEIYVLYVVSCNWLNVLYMMSIFVGGVVGFVFVSLLYVYGGWLFVVVVVGVFLFVVFVYYLFVGWLYV